MANGSPQTSSSSSSDQIPTTRRKKKFSPKVRSGCDDCKRRRVKCDERKPQCFHCLKSGIECSGYNSPAANIFQPLKVPQKAHGQFGILDVRSTDQDLKVSLGKVNNERPLVSAVKPYNSLNILRPSATTFLTSEDNAAFGFWLSWTAPMLASYGPDGGLWKEIVPQFAWRSSVVRDMLIAAVTMDLHWVRVVHKDRNDVRRRALILYTSALRSVSAGKTTSLESLVVSFVGWIFEAMMYDYRSGGVHLLGAQKLIAELETDSKSANSHDTYTLVHDNLREAWKLCSGYQNLMIKNSGKIPLHDEEWLNSQKPTTFEEARDELSMYLRACHGGIVDLPRFANFLTAWENTDRINRYNRADSAELNEASHLLFNIACALLPSDQAEGFSDDTNGTTVEYVLSRASVSMNESFKLSTDDQETMKDTITLVLWHLFTLFPTLDRWIKHRPLIEAMAEEHPAIFSRTNILERLRAVENGDVFDFDIGGAIPTCSRELAYR